MAYQLRILDGVDGMEFATLMADVEAAFGADGCWERFIEVRCVNLIQD